MIPRQSFVIRRGHDVRERWNARGFVEISCECGTVLNHTMLNPGDREEFWFAVMKHNRRDNVPMSE